MKPTTQATAESKWARVSEREIDVIGIDYAARDIWSRDRCSCIAFPFKCVGKVLFCAKKYSRFKSIAFAFDSLFFDAFFCLWCTKTKEKFTFLCKINEITTYFFGWKESQIAMDISLPSPSLPSLPPFDSMSLGYLLRNYFNWTTYWKRFLEHWTHGIKWNQMHSKRECSRSLYDLIANNILKTNYLSQILNESNAER